MNEENKIEDAVSVPETEITVFSPTDKKHLVTTIAAYRTIYDQITGKRLRIDKRLKTNYEITFPDLDQLNIKVDQLLKQYNVIAKNCIVSVVHEDEDEETFDSYERFSTYNTSNIHPIVALIVTYNFSIMCPQEKSINNYSIDIQLTPGNIPPKELEQRYRFLRFAGPTIAISCTYVDYVVGRTIVDNIKDWIKGHENIKQNKFVIFIKKRSEYVNAIIQLAGMSMLLFFVFQKSLRIVPTNIDDFNMVFRNLLIVVVICFALYLSLKSLGRRVEYGIDMLSQNSYLLLNKGDKKLKEKLERRNRSKVRDIITGLILSIVSSTAGSIIFSYIFKS